MDRRRLLWVLLACLAAWASLLPARGVWAPDEARYAQVAREMKESGRWLVPLLNGELYSQKPPLFFDLVQIASLPSGDVPEWAVKVPSLLGGLATLLITGLIGLRLMGPRGAWLAPLLLGSLFKFGWQAQFGQIDMVLAALVTGQIALGLRLAAGQGRRIPGLAAMALLAALGVLSKGAVGCLLPWLVLLAYLAARRDWSGLRRLGLQWSVPGTLLLVALWLGAAGLAAGWDYPRSLVFKQSVQRYLEPWHHKAPVYQYLGVLFADGLPFSLLLAPLAAPLIRKRAWREPGALLPLVWMGVYLVFFSLSAGKRSVYIHPLFPGMALLIAYGLLNVDVGRWKAGGFRLAYVVLGAVFAGAGAVGVFRMPEAYRSLRPFLVLGALLLTAGALAAAWWTGRGKPLQGAACLAACALAFLPLTVLPAASRLDEVKTPRAFAAAARPHLDAGGTVGTYPNLVPSVNYYLHATTPVFPKSRRADAEQFLLGGPRRLLLVQKEDWGAAGDPRFRVVHDGPIGGDRYLLLAAAGETPE
jgi:4-amino-4-deoxy-L-arabinose transferase-like glycosyltransferase